MLRVENVSYSYNGRRGASDVTLHVDDGGALIALAGPNGSGKSTLLKLIARVLTPQRGEVVLDGRSDWMAKEYARHVGYLPQESEDVFTMKAIDVVVSGRAPYLSRFAFESESDYAEAEKALALCDASYLAQRFLDEMSGGERKRVFLARVLAGAPRLILLDEPFAALDIAHVQQFSRLLRGIVDRTNSTVVFASHDLNWAAAYSDRMIVMREGSIARDASPAEVMRADVVRELFGFEAHVVDRWVVPPPHPPSAPSPPSPGEKGTRT
ncbi:MAG TPA: ABC transporter ATP-binding protein [Thermoanaerobaculia bacterium]|nr:ABC transporter ATP-binding protein [Thermoanaerobaculia bacterium]